jgi:hypothetical protein
MRTFTVGAMSKSSSVRPAFCAPSSSSGRNSWTCSGEKKIGSQPSAISPVSATFLGPMAAM